MHFSATLLGVMSSCVKYVYVYVYMCNNVICIYKYVYVSSLIVFIILLSILTLTALATISAIVSNVVFFSCIGHSIWPAFLRGGKQVYPICQPP